MEMFKTNDSLQLAYICALCWTPCQTGIRGNRTHDFFLTFSAPARYNTIYLSHFCKNRHTPYIFSLRKPYFYSNVIQ